MGKDLKHTWRCANCGFHVFSVGRPVLCHGCKKVSQWTTFIPSALIITFALCLACLAHEWPPEPEKHTWARFGDVVLSSTNGYRVTRLSTTYPEEFLQGGLRVCDKGNLIIEFSKSFNETRDVWLFHFNHAGPGVRTNETYNVFHRVHSVNFNHNERVASDDKEDDFVFVVRETQFELYYATELLSTNAHLLSMAVDFPEGQVRFESTIP
jgi:hypothetical protein